MDAHVKQALADIKKGDTAAAMILLAAAVKEDLPLVLTGCDKSKQDVQEILKALDQFKTPKDLIVHIGEDIVVNEKVVVCFPHRRRHRGEREGSLFSTSAKTSW